MGEMRDFEIVQLPKGKWKGTPILMKYTTKEYYDLETFKDDQGFHVQMIKKKFDTPVTHSPEEYDFPDKLYQDHWAGAKAWGIVRKKEANDELLACIESCPEEWSNRLIVTELWVSEELRRQGVGRRLMDVVKEQAKAEGRRVVILETQSCNVDAIAFYLSQGFELIGFDSCCYTNRDMERREVRFDFGFYLDQREGRW